MAVLVSPDPKFNRKSQFSIKSNEKNQEPPLAEFIIAIFTMVVHSQKICLGSGMSVPGNKSSSALGL